jgi:hypothetical protein
LLIRFIVENSIVSYKTKDALISDHYHSGDVADVAELDALNLISSGAAESAIGGMLNRPFWREAKPIEPVTVSQSTGRPSATTTVVDLGRITTSLEIDLAAGNTFKATMSSDITSISFARGNISDRSQRVVVYLQQDESGSHIINTPTGLVRWPDGDMPELSSSAWSVDCIVFDIIGSTVFGNLAGVNYL